jgi:hypothetical protein
MPASVPISVLQAVIASGLIASATAVFALPPSFPAPAASKSAAGYGKIPLSFEANQGQADASVKFLSHGNGNSLLLTGDGAILSLGGPARQEQVRMTLAGPANRTAKASGEAELPGKVNYFIGNDPAKWHSNLPTY